MRAFTRLRWGDTSRELVPGDIIGRVSSAALQIENPRVSEAHALVSWRYGALWLLSLRRLIAVGGKPSSEVRLEPGLQVELAEDVAVDVEAVVNPEAVMAIEASGLGRRPLSQVASVFADPAPRVVDRFEPDAAMHIWWAGDAWRARDATGLRDVEPGDQLDVGGCRFRICQVARADAGRATHRDGAVTRPLRLVSNYDTIEIHRDERPVITVGGIGARIMGELVAVGGPCEWEVAAREIWPDDADSYSLRRRWDAAVRRLRGKLREAGVRSDLLRADGAGQFQLVLYGGDVVEDRS